MAKHRSNRMIVGCLLASTFAVSVVTATAAVPQVIGITSAVLNDVRITAAAAPRPHPAALRERVALADQVQTGQRSQLQMMLLDRSVFTVGANARLTIDRFVYDPNGNRSFTASVAKGAFRFMSGRGDRGGGSSISSPVATIGIRGTIVDGVVGQDAIDIASGERGINIGNDSDPEGATLVILRGPGQRTQAGLTVGALTVTGGNKSVELDQPMLAAYVPYRGAAPIGPFMISLSGLARVQDLIFPSLAERKAAVVTTGTQPYLRPQPRAGRYRPLPYPEEGGGGPGQRPSYIPDLNLPQGGMTDQPTPSRPTSTPTPMTTPAPTSSPPSNSLPSNPRSIP